MVRSTYVDEQTSTRTIIQFTDVGMKGHTNGLADEEVSYWLVVRCVNCDPMTD